MLRNKELRHFAAWFAVLATVLSAVGFSVNMAAGVMALSSALGFGLVFYVFTRSRYQRIAKISEQIDMVLHDTDYLFINESEEGELSILQSEITKMTLRIREQNAALKREKENLADSLADIAHQLRTPLTSINLILSLLEKNPKEKERRQLLRETEELLVRMEWLITSLLKLSRLDAGIVIFQGGPVDMRALVNTALRPLLIPMELHQIDLQIRVPEGIVIQGDLDWLSEAFQNIIKNCMESAGEGGKIEIVCEDTVLFTEVSIHDSGPGFKENELSCLFERFYRGKNSRAAGYGIGLALCKTIIIRQGGTVDAENHPQGGAVFTIRFPKELS